MTIDIGRGGRSLLAMPGPTNVPDEVLSAMHRPVIDIYAGELVEHTESCIADLRRVFGTTHGAYIYAANGHGAWEAALTNVLSRGDHVLVLSSGLFADLWGRMAKWHGIKVSTLRGDPRRAVDPDALETRLREDREGRIKALLVTQVDTASSVVNDVPALRAAIDAAGHGALLMVDTIASLATMPFELDAWGVDVAVGGCQKGLMMPPGLGFVAAGERALAVHQSADLRAQYWDWTSRDGDEHYMKYCGTPPVQQIFGLRKALDMLFEEGFDQVFERHRLMAGATRAAVAAWSDGGDVEFNILEPAARSNSVTTVLLRNGREAGRIHRFCHDTCGVTLGIGLMRENDDAFRVAHMGHVNAPMMLGVLSTIELALEVNGCATGGAGVSGAVRWLAGEFGAGSAATPAGSPSAEAARA